MMRKMSNSRYDSDECHSQENTGQCRKDVSAVHFELQYYISKGIFRTNSNLESMAVPAQLTQPGQEVWDGRSFFS